MAAFADGLKDERERAEVKRVADALGADAGFDLPGLYREVLIDKPDLAQVAGALGSPEARQLAFEMALGVCDADGAQNPAEREFIQRLAHALGLDAAAVAATSQQADAVVDAAFAAGPGQPTSASAAAARQPGAAASDAAGLSGTVTGRSSMTDAETDALILKAAITNAALEILPESLASMAIIPLQVRLVYRIGKAHGYPMDASQARDFLATVGVGLTGQYLEQFGRKLLGGLLGGIGGGLGRSIGRQAASSGMSFATTYALGRVAQRYYASGRSIDATTLKQAFVSMLEEAKGLAPRYHGQIEQMAGRIDTRNLASLIKSA
ncbi:MAG: DUF533 domain-containing protein [Steroidobacteraceae bacterium]|nr:DUF533 domain-containing protein [Steroidobacteraceae bacterium]